METSSQSAVCKSFLYSKKKTKNKKHTHTLRAIQGETTQCQEGEMSNRVNHSNKQTVTRQQMERIESKISTATLARRRKEAVSKTNQSHSQLCSQVQIKICIVLFCPYVYQPSDQPTYVYLIHTRHRQSHKHTHQPSIPPVDISSAPTGSALSRVT